LVQRQGTVVLRPNAAEDCASRALGQSRFARAEPDTAVRFFGDKAKLLAVDGPQVLAMLEAVLDTADSDLRVLAGSVHTGGERVGGVLVCLSIHGNRLDSAVRARSSVEIRADIVALVSLVLLKKVSSIEFTSSYRMKLTHLAAGQNVVRGASLVTLQVLKVNKLSLYGALDDGLGKLILLGTRVGH
jgi:hypothetical protein